MSDGDGVVTELLHTVRFGQFVSVGALGATAETVVVALLTTTYGVGPLAAKAAGAELSISLMFLVNDRWTFAGHGGGGPLAVVRRWLKSHAVRLTGLAVAFAILAVLTGWTDLTLPVAGRDLWPTVANLIGIAGGLLVNYVAESLFTWRVSGR